MVQILYANDVYLSEQTPLLPRPERDRTVCFHRLGSRNDGQPSSPAPQSPRSPGSTLQPLLRGDVVWRTPPVMATPEPAACQLLSQSPQLPPRPPPLAHEIPARGAVAAAAAAPSPPALCARCGLAAGRGGGSIGSEDGTFAFHLSFDSHLQCVGFFPLLF